MTMTCNDKKDFAKIFRNDEIGQILVFMDSDDEGEPCLAIRFEYDEIGGMCTFKIGFPETDEGYENRNKAFETFTEEQALACVNHVKHS